MYIAESDYDLGFESGKISVMRNEGGNSLRKGYQLRLERSSRRTQTMRALGCKPGGVFQLVHRPDNYLYY